MPYSNEEKTILENSVSRILEVIHDPYVNDDEAAGTIETPRRVAKMFEELYEGYSLSPEEILEKRFKIPKGDHGLVVVKDINFFSMCEHHMMPFFGKVHIGYIPEKEVVGLSKFPRLVKVYSRRLQVQERMGRQIASAIKLHVKPKGVAVVIEASHMCMCARGIEAVGSSTTTSEMNGLFMDNPALRSEFMDLLK